MERLQFERALLRSGLPAADIWILATKYSEDQPRDDHGRWTAGGGGAELKDGQWVGADGAPLDAAAQSRLKELRVPPAWKNVKLNPDPEGALQVVGKDSKGRSQYIYSAAHSERAAAEKFARLKEFNDAVPAIRAKALADMNDARLSPEKRDAAAITTLIAETGVRIGSDADTGAAQKAYGATTLEGRHVNISEDTVRLSFIGKKGVEITTEAKNSALAAYLRGRQAVVGPGRLFKTNDSAVRDYFHNVAGKDFSPKDLRTWMGTSIALREAARMPRPKNDREFRRQRATVGKAVARALGNTPTVALASYIDPAVFKPWQP